VSEPNTKCPTCGTPVTVLGVHEATEQHPFEEPEFVPEWRSVVAQTRDDLQAALDFCNRWGVETLTIEARVKLDQRVRDLSRLLDEA
jgi:hypothetical protein